MATVLVFVGEKYYPAGGANDLQKVLPEAGLPSDGEIAEIFKSAAQDGIAGDDYWVNTLVLSPDGTTETHRWLAYIRKSADKFDFQEAAYATVRGNIGENQFILVPIAERISEGITRVMGPRDHPDVTFW